MLLRQLIQTRLASSFRIYDRKGNLQNPESVRTEYSRIRQYLLDNYSQDRSPVVICLIKDYHYFLTILACIELGVSYIPVTVDFPNDRLQQIKDDAQFQVVIDEKKISEALRYEKKILTEIPHVDSNDVMYVMFTSGSTGKPKGVTIQRRAVENFFTYLRDHFPEVTEAERLLQVTEFIFDGSLVDIGIFLIKGCELYFSQFEKDIFRLAYEIESWRITFLTTVPNNLNMFLSEAVAGRTDYHTLRHLFIGGGRFSYGLYQKCNSYLNSSVNVYNSYGPTETTVYSHSHKLTFRESEDCVDLVVSIGKVLPGMEAYIVSPEGTICDPRVNGELYLGGAQLLKEYINNPEQTRRSLVQFFGKIFYKTGDLAFRTEGDKYFIIGRNDDTIKYRGYRINLLDIDSYVTRLPYVQDSITIAIPHELTENLTIAFIILKEDKTVKELKQDLRELLLEFQIPNEVVFVKNYPTTDSGKVDRRALRDLYEK